LLPASRITGIFHCMLVLVQEGPALVRRQLIQDPLRVERILALGRLGAHSVIVTCGEGHGPRHARRASGSRERLPIAHVIPSTGLHQLARSSGGRFAMETVDITVPEEVAALHQRLAQNPERLPGWGSGRRRPGRSPTERRGGGGLVRAGLPEAPRPDRRLGRAQASRI
jgi:hypothetical protein